MLLKDLKLKVITNVKVMYMLISKQQKQLILNILKKEKRSIFSKYKGDLLDKTIQDLSQMLRNESINEINNKGNKL